MEGSFPRGVCAPALGRVDTKRNDDLMTCFSNDDVAPRRLVLIVNVHVHNKAFPVVYYLFVAGFLRGYGLVRSGPRTSNKSPPTLHPDSDHLRWPRTHDASNGQIT